MRRDTIRNADMHRKGTVHISSTSITKSIVKILVQEDFIENVRKHWENNKDFLVLTLQHRRNRKGPSKTILNLKRINRPGLRIYSNYQRIPRILGRIFSRYNDRPRGSIRKNQRRNLVLYGNPSTRRIRSDFSICENKK